MRGDSLQTWSVHIGHLLEEHEIGVLLGATALLLGIVSRSYQVCSAARQADRLHFGWIPKHQRSSNQLQVSPVSI